MNTKKLSTEKVKAIEDKIRAEILKKRELMQSNKIILK
jgi:hypothetical protein